MGEQYDVKGFNSSVRYTSDSTTESTLSVVHGVKYNGEIGMMTSRKDIATTIETKNGTAYLNAAR
jgi:hypothetical protein